MQIPESPEVSACVPSVIESAAFEMLIALPIAIALSEAAESTLSPITIPSLELVVPLIPMAILLFADAELPAPMAILPSPPPPLDAAEFPMAIESALVAEAEAPSAIESFPAAFAATVVKLAADCSESVPVPFTSQAEPPGKPVTVAPERSSVPVKLAEAVPTDNVELFPRPSVRAFSVAVRAPLSVVFKRPE